MLQISHLTAHKNIVKFISNMIQYSIYNNDLYKEKNVKIKSFLKLVEIQTKVASVIPFFIGVTFTLYNFGSLNVLNTLIMFAAMLIFDMTVTAANNFFDYKRAVKKHGYNYEVHNSIVQYGLKEGAVLATIIVMFILSTALGIYLVYLTDYIVLILGIICFGIGIIYSYGPLPISRTPFGEIFSGGIMGFFIPLITIYINILDEGMVTLSLDKFMLSGSLDLVTLFGIILVSTPAVLCIANIMLANNICDMDDDLENKRYTLPILVGKDKGILLLKALFYISYIAIILGVVFKFIPIYSLLVLLTIIPVQKKIKLFEANPTKKDTFSLIVANFLTVNVPLILTILVGYAVNLIF